ncbi:MAG: hypothetical protein WEC33_06330 [Dehalococcoidia bacterium]
MQKFHPRTLFAIGGFAASVILLAFGVACIFVGIDGRNEVRDTLRKEDIVGTDDSTIPGQLVDTGSEAKAFADVMRQHTLERTGGLTYSQIGRFEAADGDPAGTGDAALAALFQDGNPIPNANRDLWINETALTTALNTAYFAERVGTFSIIMGIAMILTGVGFVVLTIAALWRHSDAAERNSIAGPREAS